MTSSKGLLLLPILMLLAACGGGGGGNSNSSSNGSSTYSISGTVSGAVTSGVTIALSGANSVTTITDASGNYTFTGLANGKYTVTPSLANYTFNPVSTAFMISNANSMGNNFTDTTAVSTNNIMSITVNGALCSNNSYVNKPCVSVTICSPGTSTCQTINDILLDTGNYGLRIFRQALTVSLTQQKIGAGSLAECVQYGDGTSEWGPIQMASVVLGNEPAVQVPIQYLDSTFSTIPAMCQNADTSPSQAGFNGILGVGVFAQDCGSSCSTSPDNGLYYSCIGSTCNGTAVPLSSQVQNPVALLPNDNNGVIVKLAGVPVDGLSSVSGTLVLGIGTHSNNIPSAVTTYPTDGSGNFITLFSGISYSGSFIDSGSNGLFFPFRLCLTAALIQPGSALRLQPASRPLLRGTPERQAVRYSFGWEILTPSSIHPIMCSTISEGLT